jgi:hypothetical protein
LNGINIDQSGISGVEEPINNGAGVQVPQGLPENMGGEITPEGFGGANIQGSGIEGGSLVGT